MPLDGRDSTTMVPPAARTRSCMLIKPKRPFELTDCGVSSYSLSSGGDNPMESLSLNFLKVMVTPTPLDKSGQIKKGDVVSYDLLAMKAS